ncbi:LOW QUALITY PROTEIN: hypothetical protein ACHAXT_013273 [Thalassiosira profunda]
MTQVGPLLALAALVGATAADCGGAAAPPRLGNLPLGPHTSDAYDISSAPAARRNCDGNLHCAAISYRNDSEGVVFHTHAFVPGLVDGRNNSTGMGEEEEDVMWDTYLSAKEFVFHPGRMIVAPEDVLKFEADSSLSLAEAQEYCSRHDECVGFTFPTRHARLRGFANITFARSLTAMEDDSEEQDEWRTFVANDLAKSPRIPDATALPFVEQFDERPWRNCCARAPRDEATRAPLTLPSLSEVQSVDSLPRVPCDILQAEFQARYEHTRTPVMLVGCDARWPAKQRWDRRALLDRFDNDTAWRSTRHGGDSLDENSWGEIADDIANGSSTLDHEAGKLIEEDYETPSQFRGSDLYPSEYPNEYGSRRWWCVGTKGTGTKPHMDPLRTDAWNTVVSGHKWWILYPPSVEKEDAVVCDEDCSVEDPTPLDWYASVATHALRTAVDGDGATPVHVLQKPGETIYVPNGFRDEHGRHRGDYGELRLLWKEQLEDGNAWFWQHMYYTVLNAERRREVREGEFWPPEEWWGVQDDEEEEDPDEVEKEVLAAKDVASLREEEESLHKLLRIYEKDF